MNSDCTEKEKGKEKYKYLKEIKDKASTGINIWTLRLPDPLECLE